MMVAMIAIYRHPASLLSACCALILSTAGLRAQTATTPAPAAPAASTPAPANVDFGDYSSSAITGKAWAAFGAKDYAKVLIYTAKCRELFEGKALEMQKGLEAPPTGAPDAIHAYWALNDVGTCYYLQGQAQKELGKTEDAVASFKFLVEKLPYAQCWDTKGWFWKPADAARDQLKKLEFGAL